MPPGYPTRVPRFSSGRSRYGRWLVAQQLRAFGAQSFGLCIYYQGDGYAK